MTIWTAARGTSLQLPAGLLRSDSDRPNKQKPPPGLLGGGLPSQCRTECDSLPSACSSRCAATKLRQLSRSGERATPPAATPPPQGHGTLGSRVHRPHPYELPDPTLREVKVRCLQRERDWGTGKSSTRSSQPLGAGRTRFSVTLTLSFWLSTIALYASSSAHSGRSPVGTVSWP